MSDKKKKRRGAGSGSDEGKKQTKRGGMAAAMHKEEAKAKRRQESYGMPFRFWLEKGSSGEIIFLDHSLDDGFYRHEHNLKIDGKWGNHVECKQEHDKCDPCNDGDHASLVGFLSIIDTRPYTSGSTGETVEHSKKFFCLTRTQYEDFETIEKLALKKYGTMRGVSIIVKRGTDDKAPRIGKPVPDDEGNAIHDFLSEKQLVKEFGHAKVLNRDKTETIKEKNDDIKVYDYVKLMPPPEHGKDGGNTDHTPGSRAESAEGDGDELPGVSTTRSSRSRSRGKSSEPEATEGKKKKDKGKKKDKKKKKNKGGDAGEPDFDS